MISLSLAKETVIQHTSQSVIEVIGLVVHQKKPIKIKAFPIEKKKTVNSWTSVTSKLRASSDRLMVIT